MQFKAKAKFIHYSPYKLRPLADVIRGKNVQYALHWLATQQTRRVSPLKKIIESVAANAKSLQDANPSTLRIKDLRVDEGPMFKYFKPGAMGRAVVLRKRFSHLSVILEKINAGREE
jgi:large subunit ribosomal protein L22